MGCVKLTPLFYILTTVKTLIFLQNQLAALLAIAIPDDISTKAKMYCSLKIFSPKSIAPNMQAKTGSENFIIKRLESLPFFTM